MKKMGWPMTEAKYLQKPVRVEHIFHGAPFDQTVVDPDFIPDETSPGGAPGADTSGGLDLPEDLSDGSRKEVWKPNPGYHDEADAPSDAEKLSEPDDQDTLPVPKRKGSADVDDIEEAPPRPKVPASPSPGPVVAKRGDPGADTLHCRADARRRSHSRERQHRDKGRGKGKKWNRRWMQK